MQQIIYTKGRKIDLPCSVTHQQLRPFSDCHSTPLKRAVSTAGKMLLSESRMKDETVAANVKRSVGVENFSLLKYVNSIAWPKTFHGKSSEAARQTARQVERQADR